MPRKLVLGVGLASLLSGTAAGQQFATDRQPVGVPQQPVTKGFQPAPAAGPAPVARPQAPGGFAPAPSPTLTPQAPPLDIPLAVPPNHPWLLKPETGPWFISVKSYSRPGQPDPNDPGLTARELAEALAAEIREKHRVGAYLFEYVSEEKRAHAEAKARAVQQARAFSDSLRSFQQKSDLQGMEFLDRDQERVRIYFKTFRYRDQVAVLVGPFQTEEDAKKAAAIVRKWAAPGNERLMDGGAIVRPEGNGKVIDRTFLNPYPQAMVVPNPAVPQAPRPVEGVDPFVVKLNDGRPYNLLTAQKGWTLAVKSFSVPVTLLTRDDDPAMTKKIGSSSGGDVLAASAEQAEHLARALREMKGPGGQPLRLEAFVLHTRTSSVVTVGQFDSPEDPALHDTRRILMGLSLNVGKGPAAGPAAAADKLIGDTILPIPIPKP